MEAQPNRSLTSELIGDKSQIRKLLFTYQQSWTNIKAVVDDYYAGDNNYTAPFKYALSIIAPYVIILNVINYDLAGLFIQEFQSAPTTNTNASPEVAQMTIAFMERYNELYSVFINIAMIEFLPLYYAVIVAPIFAYFLSKFFRKDVTLRYYYAFAIYILMSICTITFFLEFIWIYMSYPLMHLFYIGSIFTALVFGYCSHKVFEQNLFKSTVKIVLVFIISQITIIIPTVIILTVLTVLTL